MHGSDALTRVSSSGNDSTTQLPPNSSAYCLIAGVAIEHGLVLLHDDRNFDNTAKVITELTLV
ncbi:MAG: hypothetical protein LC751_15920 [Actinobacteria bacterium]|nr:hypothetical protein [Actinomycetota bacterium]